MYHVPMCKVCGEHEVGAFGNGSTEFCSERCEDVAFHELRAGEYVEDVPMTFNASEYMEEV